MKDLIFKAVSDFINYFFPEDSGLTPYFFERDYPEDPLVLVGVQKKGLRPLILISQRDSFASTEPFPMAKIYENIAIHIVQVGLQQLYRNYQSDTVENYGMEKSFLDCPDRQQYPILADPFSIESLPAPVNPFGRKILGILLADNLGIDDKSQAIRTMITVENGLKNEKYEQLHKTWLAEQAAFAKKRK